MQGEIQKKAMELRAVKLNDVCQLLLLFISLNSDFGFSSPEANLLFFP